MGAKGEQIAARFEEANADFIRKLEALTPEQWSKTCEETGWSVGVTAHHVAEDHAVLARLISGVASGASMPPVTAEMLNGMNAEHAQRATGVSREETVHVARTSGSEASQTLRGLSDEQLQNKLSMQTAPGGAQEVTAEWIAENILIGHMGMHLPMIEKAIS